MAIETLDSSYHLNHLNRHYPQLTLPKLIIGTDDEMPNCSGAYYSHIEFPLIQFSTQTLENKTGLIYINQPKDNSFESILNHEFRHHVQHAYYAKTNKRDPGGWNYLDLPYKQAIINYFLTYSTELDAHLYTLKHSPRRSIESFELEWTEWIIKHLENTPLARHSSRGELLNTLRSLI